VGGYAVVHVHEIPEQAETTSRIPHTRSRGTRAGLAGAAKTREVTILPANEASREDLEAAFGTRGDRPKNP
jgi:hypothetical protein